MEKEPVVNFNIRLSNNRLAGLDQLRSKFNRAAQEIEEVLYKVEQYPELHAAISKVSNACDAAKLEWGKVK